MSAAVELAVTDDGVARVTLVHPGRLNALTVAMWRDANRLFTELSDRRDVRVVVLTGAEGNFAAGADIREFPQERSNLARVQHYHTGIIAPALHAVAACPHPVIARIAGVCVGGGLELACQCDIRIAARSARFGVPINRLGFPMAPDEMRGLLALVGRARTLEILLEGRIFGAVEALEKGLLTRVVEDDALDAETDATVARILRGAPLAARENKRLAARLTPAVEPLSDTELRTAFAYAETRDHKEGVRAFLAGEEPIFTGE